MSPPLAAKVSSLSKVSLMLRSMRVSLHSAARSSSVVPAREGVVLNIRACMSAE